MVEDVKDAYAPRGTVPQEEGMFAVWERDTMTLVVHRRCELKNLNQTATDVRAGVGVGAAVAVATATTVAVSAAVAFA